MTVSEEFGKIARKASTEAGRVNCSSEDYRDGLQLIIDLLYTDIAANLETNPAD